MSRKDEKRPLKVPESPSRTKKWLFLAFLLATPVTFFVIFELALRLSGYAADQDLVVQKEVNGKKVFQINRSAAKRYFAASGTIIPEPADDTFALEKPKHTKRIFCLGESTMAGFPYEFNATAPSFLRDRLKAEFPNYNFEVVNVGLSAISSFIVLDFIRDLARYDPDLFIVYTGHNEFYGIYGTGSSIQVPGGFWITRLTIFLLHYRTFLLVRDILGWFKRQFFQNPSRATGTLMEQMVKEQYIPLASSSYVQTKSNFERNLVDIIETANDHRIPIVFSTLVSNLKDQPPFHGLTDTSADTGRQKQWLREASLADSNLAAKDWRPAQLHFQDCIHLDSLNASGFYGLGKALYALGDFSGALRAFLRAKDLDGLRFRASQEFEESLERTCLNHGAFVAHVDTLFATHSAHAIVGNELILEHLHPNLEGYFLMAKAFEATIREGHLLFPSPEQGDVPLPSDQLLWAQSGVTEFDEALGRMKVAILTHEPPFTRTNQRDLVIPKNAVESLVLRYIQGTVYWSKARYEFAEYNSQNGNFSAARGECFAVSKVIPYSYQPLLRIADYYELEGKADSAAAAYRRCYETEDNPYARIKLAFILLKNERANDALLQLQAAFSLTSRPSFTFTAGEESFCYYLLGVANAKLRKFDVALEYARRALSLDAGSRDARILIAQLESIRSLSTLPGKGK